MTFLPGWDSIETAARWHRGFELAGFVALGLLLLFEVLAYIYASRKDALLAAANTQIEQQRQQQDEAANRARDAQIKRAQEQARKAVEDQARAQEEITRLHDAQKPREITGPNLQILTANLRQHKATLGAIRCVVDPEAKAFGMKLVNAILASGWNIGIVSQSDFSLTAQGLVYAIPDPQNPTDEQQNLISALHKAGINPTLQVGKDEILVGFRVPK